MTRAEFSLSSSSSSSPCVGPYGRDRPQGDAALDPRNYGSWTGPYPRANNLGTLTLLLAAERLSPTLSHRRHTLVPDACASHLLHQAEMHCRLFLPITVSGIRTRYAGTQPDKKQAPSNDNPLSLPFHPCGAAQGVRRNPFPVQLGRGKTLIRPSLRPCTMFLCPLRPIRHLSSRPFYALSFRSECPPLTTRPWNSYQGIIIARQFFADMPKGVGGAVAMTADTIRRKINIAGMTAVEHVVATFRILDRLVGSLMCATLPRSLRPLQRLA